MLNWVDLVGLGYSIRLRDLNGVGLGDLLLVDDLTLNRDRDWNWDLDWDLVDVEFRLDASHRRSDSGVSPDGCNNPLL